ncbi:MAG: BMP family ABC transporter substrate-binding protein [Lachnospiraceae bacterium]|nr:BMP family ABC transporter substrate-binding protein [Lachnospiraceae bacterium]
MKKIIPAFIMLSLCILLVSCTSAGSTYSKKSKKDADEKESEAAPAESEKAIEDTMQKITADVTADDLAIDPEESDNTNHDPDHEEIAGSSYRIAMVTDSAGINDHSFNQGAWEGLTKLNEDTGATVKYMGTKTEADYIMNIESLIKEDYTFIWGIGYESADSIMTEAKKHPETKFAIIDQALADPVENVTGVTFRAEEPSFMAGYIACAVTQSGQVGFVGGVPGDTIDAFQYGYEAGVAYANKELGKDVTVDAKYTGSFTETGKAYEIAKNMYSEGTVVIYHAAGAAGMGVIEAAKEGGDGCFVIGVDRDQAYLAPDNVLTSVIKNISLAIENVSVQYMLNDNINGINLDFGLSEHAVGISTIHDNYPENVYERVLEIGKDIASGIITVPKDDAGYSEFVSSLGEG